MRPLIAANWKMHGLRTDLEQIARIAAAAALRPDVDVMFCPPATLISEAARIAADRIAIGGQNCHADVSGHHTGDISAEMLRDAGAKAVITGHSERRRDHGETNEIVAAKVKAARRAGLLAIVCIGDSELQRADGNAYSICGGQIVASVPTGVTEADIAIGTSRSGRSARVTYRRPRKSCRCTRTSANVSSLILAREANASASSTGVPSTPPTPARFWRCQESTELS